MPKKKQPSVEEAAAAQAPGPDPGPQHHTWAGDQAAYDAQIALPCHLVAWDTILAATEAEAREWQVDPGHPYRLTLCGQRLGSELLRTTDDRAQATCLPCKRKRPRK